MRIISSIKIILRERSENPKRKKTARGKEKNYSSNRALIANIAAHVDLVPIEFDQAGVCKKQKNRVDEVDFIRKAARQRRDYFFNIRDILGRTDTRSRSWGKERRYGERRSTQDARGDEINFRKGKQAILVHLNIARTRAPKNREGDRLYACYLGISIISFRTNNFISV